MTLGTAGTAHIVRTGHAGLRFELPTAWCVMRLDEPAIPTPKGVVLPSDVIEQLQVMRADALASACDLGRHGALLSAAGALVNDSGLLITAGLTVGLFRVRPGSPPVDMSAVAAGLDEGDGLGRVAGIVDLPSGQSVRARVLQYRPSPLNGDAEVPWSVTQYAIPIPGRSGIVLFDFGTPSLEYEDELVELFDEIAMTASYEDLIG